MYAYVYAGIWMVTLCCGKKLCNLWRCVYACICVCWYMDVDFVLWKEAVQSVEVCLCMHIYVGWYMHGDLVEDRSNAVCGSRA
jgi:hypothetical protein